MTLKKHTRKYGNRYNASKKHTKRNKKGVKGGSDPQECGVDEDGNKFGCPPGKGYNYKDMKDMLDNIHEYMGQTATFTYFERTKAGSYRHPLFKCIRNYE